MRQTFKQTYNEIKAAYAWNGYATATPAKKCYWVGVDPVTGIMSVSCDIHDIVGLEDVKEVFAHNSEAARLEYNSLR